MLNIHKLNELIKEKKYTNLAISKILKDHGIKKSETAIQKYRHGINDPDTMTLSILADILDVSEQDFFVGAKKRRERIAFEEIKKHPLKYKHIFDKENVKNELKQIELIGSDSKNIYIDNFCLKKENLSDEIFAFVVGGDSMYPYLSDKDIVLYKAIGKDEILNDGKFVIDTPVGLQVKNIKFMLNGDVRIISENSSYHANSGYDEEIEKCDFESVGIIGVVIGRIMQN